MDYRINLGGDPPPVPPDPPEPDDGD